VHDHEVFKILIDLFQETLTNDENIRSLTKFC